MTQSEYQARFFVLTRVLDSWITLLVTLVYLEQEPEKLPGSGMIQKKSKISILPAGEVLLDGRIVPFCEDYEIKSHAGRFHSVFRPFPIPGN